MARSKQRDERKSTSEKKKTTFNKQTKLKQQVKKQTNPSNNNKKNISASNEGNKTTTHDNNNNKMNKNKRPMEDTEIKTTATKKVKQHLQAPTNHKPHQPSSSTALGNSSNRLDKYRQKIQGAKFRILNESLYTGTADNLSKTEFETYHEGFASQVLKWPTNPVDEICKLIRDQFPSSRSNPLKIGDLGCGEARLGKELKNTYQVYSFDLVAANPSVQECDVSKGVPLDDGSLDLVVFSLSLMGSNVTQYIFEANRLLKKNAGEMIIAEVKSRFSEEGEKSSEDMHRGLKRFCGQLKLMGFELLEADTESNVMFVLLRFQKKFDFVEEKDGGKKQQVKVLLKSCPYKRR